MKHFSAATLRKFFPVLFLFGIFSGCRIINPAEDIPSYIHIDSITLSTSGNQGSNSSKITDAWIFVDSKLIGGFELPCTVPVLADGTHHILIRAGIKQNGLSSTRAIYPFYKGWEGDVALTKATVTTINPVISYFPGLDFSSTWMDNFEVAYGFTADTIYHSQITLCDSPYVFEGLHSAYIRLSADTIQFIGRSPISYSFQGASDAYLEMDYRCNIPFTVGLVNGFSYYPWATVGESETWNKIYIRLNDAVVVNGSYQVYIGMFKFPDVAEPYLYVDNIKLLKY
ncbi:MAG: hypothetical protein HY064_14745 [Bacteroidetes bacterium]|nr:hypothetical protein [Bacteroidota bacterium]